MANVDAPRGFVPIKHRNGAPYNGAVNPYYVSNANNADLFVGDLVLITGTSNTASVSVVGGDFAIGTLPTVLVCTASDGNRCSGAIVSFSASPTALETTYRVNQTERVAWVADDPDLVFEVQGDTATAPAATDVGAGFPLINGTGSTTTGLSGMELDISEGGQNAQDMLILVRMVNRVDNDTTAIHAKCEVIISNHTSNPEGAETNDGILPV